MLLGTAMTVVLPTLTILLVVDLVALADGLGGPLLSGWLWQYEHASSRRLSWVRSSRSFRSCSRYVEDLCK